MTQHIYYHTEMEGRNHSEYTLEQSKSKTQLGISMPDVKALFRSPNPFIFVDCNILISLELLPHTVCSFPQ